MRTLANCHSCGSQALETILSFGEIPLADVLLGEDQLDQVQAAYPLDLLFCPNCSLVQVANDIPPEELYVHDYAYYSSVLPGLVRHFNESADQIMAIKPMGEESLVIEAASNDGYMLKRFKEADINVLGIDPAEGPARVANEEGIPTIADFFSKDIAMRLSKQGRLCDVFVGHSTGYDTTLMPTDR